eukprot:TRINITY_DN19128_c0_g1_i1.p1 TRINITY_DN19128_c0_g1~~TRINITY_DN19128_c0_g1_i1.p1  ORF type:complete len:1261 (-),score=247.02 TRINITY_DN19128_c0_g1_i1:97-3879(-)
MDVMSMPPSPLGREARGGTDALDVVRDEPSLRLGCLELYVRLAGPKGKEPKGRDSCGFVVEEDQRQRVLVHWRGEGVASEDLQGKREEDGEGSSCQSWRVSCAFSPGNSEAALFETLGFEAVEWLWDGLSALVLSLGPQSEVAATAAPFFGRGCGSNGEKLGGLLGFILRELCRRASADSDPARYCLGISLWELWGSQAEDLLAADDEDAARLRFETVRFQTPEEVLELLQASGLLSEKAASDVESQALAASCLQCGNVYMPDAIFCRNCGRRRGTPVQRHVFVRIVVFDANRESLAALHFAQVAGSPDDMPDPDMVADRKALWRLLDGASAGDSPQPTPGCRLSEVLSPLLAANCKPFLLCTVPERPDSKDAAAEAHGILDLAERASLITAQCTRVQGISREGFRLADLETVLPRLGKRPSPSARRPPRPSGLPTAAFPSPAAEPVSVRSNAAGEATPQRRSLELVCDRSTEGLAPSVDDEVIYREEWPSPRTLPFTGTAAALSTPTPSPSASPSPVVYSSPVVRPAAPELRTEVGNGLPLVPVTSDSQPLVKEVGSSTVVVPAAPVSQPSRKEVHPSKVRQQHTAATPAKGGGKPAANDSSGPGSAAVAAAVTAASRQASLQKVQAADEAAMLKECQELAAACAALKAKNAAKAARRQREIDEVKREITSLHQALENFEDGSEARELLQAFRQEANSLRLEVEMLREENAALSGSRGEERRLAAQRAALQSLQQEAAKLRSSAGEVEKGEKRAHLVQRCLEEVRSRLDLAKRRKAETERDISELRPTCSELSRQLEVAERERRWVHGELDKLRRTSTGLRAEISQLREVRGAIDSLPPGEDLPFNGNEDGQGDGHGSASSGASSLERFAMLQRRLAAAAPQLMPLCSRATAEMEELLQCCTRLEERQRRLQQVVLSGNAGSDGLDFASASIGSTSARGLGSRQRARSSDTLQSGANGKALANVGEKVRSGQQRQARKLSRSPFSSETLGGRSARSSAAVTPRGSRTMLAFPSPSTSTLGLGNRDLHTQVLEQGPADKEQVRNLCCSNCGQVCMPDSLFCRHCGQKRESTRPTACPTCGNAYMADSNFCRLCGEKRQALSTATFGTGSRDVSPRRPSSAMTGAATGASTPRQARTVPAGDAKCEGYAKTWTRTREKEGGAPETQRPAPQPQPHPTASAASVAGSFGSSCCSGAGLRSTAGTLGDLGFHVPPGQSNCVRGVQLQMEPKTGATRPVSRDRTPLGSRPKPRATPAWKSPRSR